MAYNSTDIDAALAKLHASKTGDAWVDDMIAFRLVQQGLVRVISRSDTGTALVSLIMPKTAAPMTKKTAAQLEREIKAVLSRKLHSSTDPLVQRAATDLEEAAYAVFERPGGEDLTRAEFHEEVRGMLRSGYEWSRGSSEADRHIDTLYKRIYGGV